jgi:hypothetical protein
MPARHHGVLLQVLQQLPRQATPSRCLAQLDRLEGSAPATSLAVGLIRLMPGPLSTSGSCSQLRPGAHARGAIGSGLLPAECRWQSQRWSDLLLASCRSLHTSPTACANSTATLLAPQQTTPQPSPWGSCHKRRFKLGMHGTAAWARRSDERNRVIAVLGTLSQAEAYWAQWGGQPGAEGAATPRGKPHARLVAGAVAGQHCRLDFVNLARFLQQLSVIVPRNALLWQPHPTPYPHGHHGGQQQPGEQLAPALGSKGAPHGHGWSPTDSRRVGLLVEDVCTKLRLRGSL